MGFGPNKMLKTHSCKLACLKFFQAHQYSHHKSKISIMTCEPEILRAVALQAEHVHMPHYLHDARLLCHSMLTSMYKTVHRENRDACGPALPILGHHVKSQRCRCGTAMLVDYPLLSNSMIGLVIRSYMPMQC